MLQRSYEIARELGDRTEMAYALADTVRVEVERGNLDVAASAIAQSLPRVVTAGVRVIIPLLLEGAGCLAAALEEDRAAVQPWSAATAERTASGFVNMPADERLLDARVDRVRARIDAVAFADAWRRAAFPFALTRIADEPKSKSGPLAAGQFVPIDGHATLKASPDVICRDHASFPDAASNASMASDMPVGGSE